MGKGFRVCSNCASRVLSLGLQVSGVIDMQQSNSDVFPEDLVVLIVLILLTAKRRNKASPRVNTQVGGSRLIRTLKNRNHGQLEVLLKSHSHSTAHFVGKLNVLLGFVCSDWSTLSPCPWWIGPWFPLISCSTSEIPRAGRPVHTSQVLEFGPGLIGRILTHFNDNSFV